MWRSFAVCCDEHQGDHCTLQLRRDHWHGLWTGPSDGERKFVYKWLPGPEQIRVYLDTNGLIDYRGCKVLGVGPAILHRWLSSETVIKFTDWSARVRAVESGAAG